MQTSSKVMKMSKRPQNEALQKDNKKKHDRSNRDLKRVSGWS